MKETYKVKAPKSIIIGDPWYFEQYSGDELDRLTVMESVPPWLNEARVTLEEKTCEEFPDLKILGMSIYIAPKQTIDTYLGGMMYGAQMSVDKTIGVDTAKYTLQINNKEDTIYTGADGACGIYHRLKHGLNPHTFFDAIIIHLEFSSDLDSMDSMREHLNYLFENVEQIENAPEPDVDESEDQGINMGGM